MKLKKLMNDNTSILDQILLHGNDNYNHNTNKRFCYLL